MDVTRRGRQVLTLSSLLAVATRAALPYSPTRLYTTGVFDEQIAYILEPPSSSSPQGQLQAIPLTSIDTTSPSFTTITSSLPFLAQNQDVTFTSAVTANGTIFVYTGNCSSGVSGSQVWAFQPDSTSSSYSGAWTRQLLDASTLPSSSRLTGANYLAEAITFTSTLDGPNPTNFYVFGGMCPTSRSTEKTWISSADYSNQVLSLTSSSTGSNGSNSFAISALSSPSDLIDEAGFSMTPLQPTFSNNSDGTLFQQQDFVVLGGQTQSAFISTSKVALFSLPQANWTFLDVEPPSAGDADLVRERSVLQFTPRSGHSAVLTSDGSQVVIFGGWVGDTSQAATPQLAVLDVGAGYGGSGSWSWSAPSQQGLPFTNGGGLYGHGATILPGNVMLVAGGYSIATNPGQSVNSETYLYNISSGSWITSYSLPSSSSSSPSSSSIAKKVGLGLGLSLGLLAVLAAVIFGVVYYRRLKHRRLERQRELNGMADPSQHFQYEDIRGGVDGRGGAMSATGLWGSDAYPWAASTDGVVRGSPGTGMHTADRTGAFLDIPSPTRGLRRNLSNRTNYQVGSRLDGPHNMIHPIEERDEDESSLHSRAPGMVHNGKPLFAGENDAGLDPFRDPEPSSYGEGNETMKRKAILSLPVLGKPSMAETSQKSTQPWIREAVNSGKASNGRSSPDKSERTSSTLSEQSTRSFLSSISALSVRSALSFGYSGRPSYPPVSRNPFNSQVLAPDNSRRSPTRSEPFYDESDETSYRTAKSKPSFPQLQTESENLLGGIDDGNDDPNFSYRTGGKSSPTRVRSHKMALVGGLVGSVRRALPNALRSASMTSATVQPRAFLDRGVDRSSTMNIQSLAHGEDIGSSVRPVPRRTASDGNDYWAHKRGAKDWAEAERQREEEDDWNAAPANGTKYGALSAAAGRKHSQSSQGNRPVSRREAPEADDDDNDDWDIETAIQERRVQVMFTVPREKLRVVNAEIASIISEGDSDEKGMARDGLVRSSSIRSVVEASVQRKESNRGKSTVMDRVLELEEKMGAVADVEK